MHRHQVQHGWRLLAGRARPTGAQDGVALAQDLGLHEKIAEGRMQLVGRRRRQHHLGVTGDLDFPALPRAVGDAGPAQLDVVFRRDDDLGIRLELPFPAARHAAQRIAPAELGAPFGEDRLVMIGAPERRLEGG